MSDHFFTTQWTRVIAAKGETEDARLALSELCEAYYDPVVGFLRKEGRSEDDARELAHGFFAWLLSRDALSSLEEDRSRFRSYLLGALKHFITNQREKASAQKRGSQVTHLNIQSATDTSPGLDPADPLGVPPDREFDRQWALHLIRQALGELKTEWTEAGKEQEFLNLRPFLDGNASHGDLTSLAERTGQNENTLRSQLHRLRRAFRKRLKAQVSPTVSSSQETSNELNTLVDSLRPR
ncbi:MAG: sigma-70 family RNA polymerase sigma factor [Akkermansiaceae bacterium]|nr:sigma-70 family RNA polymerase sigma factor [Akkermansiaceae bacterium]NNM29538.1 sigma-70 family RNA polymerase sigma factor [Akkermansiaceae bacterium]